MDHKTKETATSTFLKGFVSSIGLEDSCPKYKAVSSAEAIEKYWRSVGDYIRYSMREVSKEIECQKAEKE